MRTAALVVAGLMLVMLGCCNAEAVDTAASHDCPVTLPATQQTTANGSEFIHSGNHLHVWLPTEGRWSESPHNLRWYYNGAARTRALPQLKVMARRIDGDDTPAIIAPPKMVRYEDNAAALVTRVELPAAGCWRISGQYGDEHLSFVVWAE